MKHLIFVALLSSTLSAWAAIDTYEFNTDSERVRYRQLVEELRCPKCQNQNIADSNAPIAMDLRREIYRMLKEGQSNEQIVDFLVDRYGDFVRYNPPLNFKTLVLWLGPLTLLLGGALVVRLIVRRRQTEAAEVEDTTLTEDERARLASLLDSKRHD